MVQHGWAASPIPEPGMVWYGAVTPVTGGTSVEWKNADWEVAGGGASSRLRATMVNVNGSMFYVVTVPFETRTGLGFSTEGTPNILPLGTTSTVFQRAAWVDGKATTVGAGTALGTFQFGAPDRGQVERIDLGVSAGGGPDVDSDGDGVSDAAERVAGTDPLDAQSVFRVLPDLTPGAEGGWVIRWASIPGRRYTVLRTTELERPFERVGSDIPATASVTLFSDRVPPASERLFYRIRVEP